MSQDDRFVLQEILRQEHQRVAPKLTLDKFFEIFSTDQVLKSLSLDLDLDQIRSGITGNAGDGGVDSFYVLVNRKLVREDTDLAAFRGQQLSIDLIVVQAKNSPGFSEAAISKLSDFTEHALRLNADPARAKMHYRQGLLDSVAKFHEIYTAALRHRPQLSIQYYYASLGEQIDKKVEAKARDLIAKAKSFFSIAACDFTFAGAKKLHEWFYRSPSKTLEMHTARSLPWTGYGKAYVCIVPLKSFYEFIADGGVLRGHIFEANVRDYQGEVEVNNNIFETLTSPVEEEFWWLNNGITLLASHVTSSGDLFSITDPLIVNGLQTSHEIFSHFKALPTSADDRTILVRVIETTSPTTVDRIIKATNSQTKIPKVWLHATEPIHRQIETVLKGVDLYYDRRKNHYRLKGVEPAKIVTLPYLAQALTAIVLQRPDDARGRPTTAAERHYKKLYSEKYPKQLYATCALAQKRVDEFLDGLDIDRSERLNLMFHLSMYATCAALASARPKRPTIAALDVSLLTDAFLQDCLSDVRQRYNEHGADDKAAKGPEMTIQLKLDLERKYKPRRHP